MLNNTKIVMNSDHTDDYSYSKSKGMLFLWVSMKSHHIAENMQKTNKNTPNEFNSIDFS